MQNNNEQHEQQPIDDGVNQNGDPTCPHVHEVDRVVPPRQLEDHARAEEGEEGRGDDGRRPILHSSLACST